MALACNNAGEMIAKNVLDPVNQWAMALEDGPDANMQAALDMLNLLINYAAQFADAGPVLGKVAKIAEERLRSD